MALKELLGVAAGAATGPVGLIASAIPGIAKGIGSLFGGRARRRRQRQARKQQQAEMNAFKALDLSNPYADIQNQFEDMTVSTLAADRQQEVAQQNVAQLQSSAIQSGMDPAAITQRLKQILGSSQQAIRADLGKQELAVQSMIAQGAAKADELRGKGQAMSQQMEAQRQSALLGMANQELAAANKARAQATADLVGGIGALGSAAIGAFSGSNPNAPANEIVGTGFVDNVGLATGIGLGEGSKFNRFLQGKANDKNTSHYSKTLGALGNMAFNF